MSRRKPKGAVTDTLNRRIGEESKFEGLWLRAALRRDELNHYECELLPEPVADSVGDIHESNGV